jgi:Protein of unknown function (DUF2752)
VNEAFAQRVALGDGDVRVAAGVLLGCAALRAVAPGDVGVPCPLRELTGVPCPLCGMTTSVTAAVELELGAAVAANPGGVVLVVLALAVLLGPGRRLTVRAGLIYLALAALWLWELERFSII